ncbi:MAG: Membrane sensor protein UhpC [bacterium]|nr:Membrane sensor protein UhpC [bacterium]
MSSSAALPAPPALSREQNLWRWRVLVATYMAYAGYYLTRKAFTICKKTIAEDFGWSLQDVAHLWTAYLVAYLVGQFLCSFIGREKGPRFLLLGGLGLSMIFNTILGFGNSYGTFLVFMFFNGLVQASGWPGSVGGVSAWLRKQERGTFMEVWSTSYLVGNMLVKSLGGALLGAYGWRWSFWGLTLATVGLWFLVYLWQRNRPEDVGLEAIVAKEAKETHAVEASQEAKVSLREYNRLALNPVILVMGMAYFCIKFLRYALDSWLPAFLDIQGLDADTAAYYSQIFDFAGLGGAVVAGYVLDRFFRGNWAMVCLLMGVGMIGGYYSVIYFGTSPLATAICFGLVGFMIYGPDTLLVGAAAIQVAGPVNGVAVAGIVNGFGSIGPVIQEEVIGWLMRGDVHEGIRNTNLLALSMSVLFAVLMVVLVFRVRSATKDKPRA